MTMEILKDIFVYLFTYLFFFGIPTACIVIFIVCLCKYRGAKKKLANGIGSPEAVKNWKTAAISLGICAGVTLAGAVGFMILILSSIAYM